MKLRISKILIVCFLFSQAVVIAQDNKLKIHALSIGGGLASTTSESAETGLGLAFDFATIVNNHLFSFFLNVGSDIRTAEGKELFLELDMTYGSKWQISPYLVIEGHLGAGLFTYNLDIGPNLFGLNFPDATIGFPFRAKLIYYPANRIGIGLNPNVNFNSIITTYNLNLIIQYNFN